MTLDKILESPLTWICDAHLPKRTENLLKDQKSLRALYSTQPINKPANTATPHCLPSLERFHKRNICILGKKFHADVGVCSEMYM